MPNSAPIPSCEAMPWSNVAALLLAVAFFAYLAYLIMHSEDDSDVHP